MVKNVKRAGKNKIALYASDKEPVMLLSKRFSVVPLSELEGEWNIVKVYGDTLSTDLEVRPGVRFDIADGRISGNSGCNRITGELRSDETVENSISFHGVAATRMMCPDMETEKNILSALNNVRTYDPILFYCLWKDPDSPLYGYNRYIHILSLSSYRIR